MKRRETIRTGTSTLARRARSALILAAAAGLLGGGSQLALAETVVSVEPDAGPQCLASYAADGNSAVVAVGAEIPYENVAGGPYTSAAITAQPDSRALASEDYEGYAGEVVLGTSGFYPANPTTSNAYYPQPVGGRTADQHDDGPFAHSSAYAEPRKATADARALDFGMQGKDGGGGVSSAHSDSAYDGTVVKGTQVATGYDLVLGALHIDWLRSVVDFHSDGTQAGSVGTWSLEFHGVRNGSTAVSNVSGDGWSFQGGNASPGEAQRKQFNDQQQKFSQALEAAGIGQADLQVQPGTVSVGADHMDIKGAGLIARLAPKAVRGQTTQAGSVQLGRVEQHVRTGVGPCDAVSTPPSFTQQAPPSGPNPPKFPPDKCTQNGCTPQQFPPSAPPGPPGLPGGKQPSI
jgi:hypothetical protein